jgi:glycopeptide antibiotics resistance protein
MAFAIRSRQMIAPLLIYVGIIGFITLTPREESKDNRVLDAVLKFLERSDLTSWISFAVLERSANVLLFVPLGLLSIHALGRHLWQPALGLGVGYSAFIELSQLLLPGRVADPADVLMNGLGTSLGAMIGAATISRRERRSSVR